TLDQWKRFIWSDECFVEWSKSGGAKWVWRKEGEDPFTAAVVNSSRSVFKITSSNCILLTRL
ncbi:hypothetical protein L211DRAFT_797940, partial [Terfezia boudieri ATCC MYA-4762]